MCWALQPNLLGLVNVSQSHAAIDETGYDIATTRRTRKLAQAHIRWAHESASPHSFSQPNVALQSDSIRFVVEILLEANKI